VAVGDPSDNARLLRVLWGSVHVKGKRKGLRAETGSTRQQSPRRGNAENARISASAVIHSDRQQSPSDNYEPGGRRFKSCRAHHTQPGGFAPPDPPAHSLASFDRPQDALSSPKGGERLDPRSARVAHSLYSFALPRLPCGLSRAMGGSTVRRVARASRGQPAPEDWRPPKTVGVAFLG
jgi:hypothetical protein